MICLENMLILTVYFGRNRDSHTTVRCFQRVYPAFVVQYPNGKLVNTREHYFCFNLSLKI